MRLFYNCEFIENGSTIVLVSIGMVSTDGREYYAVSEEFDPRDLHADPWLTENVWPHLPLTTHNTLDVDHPSVKSRFRIASDIREFLQSVAREGGVLELWSWYAAYDHVALCQLWGRMVDHPHGVPMYTRDLQQEADRLGVSDAVLPKRDGGEHHALADAKYHLTIARALGIVGS